MQVELIKIGAWTDNLKKGETLCFVHVNRTEALALIKSLTVQLLENNSNAGRLESFCKGDVDEFTISVLRD